MPYQQLIGDCNPDKPTHWIKKGGDAGRFLLLSTTHKDNPEYWDEEVGDWTQKGRVYIARLDALTGARKERLRHGRWVMAEGAVYADWSRDLHTCDSFDMPSAWPRYLSVDFGFTNPFVCQWWAHDTDHDILYCYREIYYSQRLVEDHAKRILALMGYVNDDDYGVIPIEGVEQEPLPSAIICYHDAEDRATLERHLGMRTTPATKNISGGIQAVASRLLVDPKHELGLPVKTKLAFFRGGVDEVDPRMIEYKHPTCTPEEIDGYVWDARPLLTVGELPLKVDDHGCDGLRYMVAQIDGIFEPKAKQVPMAWDPISTIVGFSARERDERGRRERRDRADSGRLVRRSSLSRVDLDF